MLFHLVPDVWPVQGGGTRSRENQGLPLVTVARRETWASPFVFETKLGLRSIDERAVSDDGPVSRRLTRSLPYLRFKLTVRDTMKYVTGCERNPGRKIPHLRFLLTVRDTTKYVTGWKKT